MKALRRIENLLTVSSQKGFSRSRKGVLNRLMDLSDQSAAAYIHDQLLETETLVFSSKQGLRDHFFGEEQVKQVPGQVLDFGVATGASTLMLGDALRSSPNREVVGFDAFLGIRDAWSKVDRPPGSMNLDGLVPDELVSHPKISVQVGWVEDTLPPFLKENGDVIALAHLDLDVYPPTRFALEALKPLLVSGSRLIFDDYFGFIGWQAHSHLAFSQVFDRHEFRCIGLSPANVAFQFL